jgi:hypothetical protein
MTMKMIVIIIMLNLFPISSKIMVIINKIKKILILQIKLTNNTTNNMSQANKTTTKEATTINLITIEKIQ